MPWASRLGSRFRLQSPAHGWIDGEAEASAPQSQQASASASGGLRSRRLSAAGDGYDVRCSLGSSPQKQWPVRAGPCDLARGLRRSVARLRPIFECIGRLSMTTDSEVADEHVRLTRRRFVALASTTMAAAPG